MCFHHHWFQMEIFPTFRCQWLSYRNVIIVRKFCILPLSPLLPPISLELPAFLPLHPERRATILWVFCELELGGYLSREEDVIMLSEGGKKVKRKKRGEKNDPAPPNPLPSPTLDAVVQGLASLGLGWGCPAPGPVCESKSSRCRLLNSAEEFHMAVHCAYEWAGGLPQTAWDRVQLFPPTTRVSRSLRLLAESLFKGSFVTNAL